ncbi:hypothetical protein KIW84_075344 [Lathyrus oleraceus]|uniref:Reverse transcriptase/retrotransposon-derived protein RNase H-like domain-containing protein n=1 Tax=Pisum sativum TaxID=3888 RepID=A0A9D4VV23_PEA|nr:hypothetical protein KIW84_075344 [Pisum sativum]
MLTRKGQAFVWDSKCEEGFQELKRRLTTALILILPSSSESFEVYCDASLLGLGGVLMQNKQAVIEFVFELVVDFRTYSFLRNWNRRSGSPPTAENAENSAFCLVLAQEQLLSCVNRLTQGVNRLTLC